MQLIMHTGAHFTEEDRLMKCLLRNNETFLSHGVYVPKPGSYRKLLRQTLGAMAGGEFVSDEDLGRVEALISQASADRMLLSNAHFFGAPRAALRQGVLYPNGPERMMHLQRLFPGAEVELFMAIRNPATFLPACFEKSPRETVDAFLDGRDPREVRWSHTFARLREAVPDVKITVWCNEDAPPIWPQIVRGMAALPSGAPIVGGFDLLADIISDEGMEHFTSYIESRPELTEAQIRRVIAAFLEKFALDEAIEEEIDMPGWSEEVIRSLTEIYDEDVFALSEIPGVQVIMP